MADNHENDTDIQVNSYNSALNEKHLQEYRAENQRKYNPVHERKANTGMLAFGIIATAVTLPFPAVNNLVAYYTFAKLLDRLSIWAFPMTDKKASREDLDALSINVAATIPFAQLFPRLQDIMVKHRGLYKDVKL